MSQRGIDFFEAWLQGHIDTPVGYAEEGKPNPDVPPLVAQCLADAKAAGITRKEIEEDCGPIGDRISEALKEAVDNEVERQIAKDKS